MSFELLDKLEINPFKFSHYDFKDVFIELTHYEKLSGSEFKSIHTFENISVELKEYEDLNKELRINFENIDTYFTETLINKFYSILGNDALLKGKYTEYDYRECICGKLSVLRSFSDVDYDLNIFVNGKTNVYFVVKTKIIN